MQKTFDEIFNILQQGGEVNFRSHPDGMLTIEIIFNSKKFAFQITIELKENTDKKIFDTLMAERLKKGLDCINDQF